MHGSRTRDCSGQRPQLDVSAMHSFTEVSNETPSPVLVSKSKRRLDLKRGMAYHCESYQACRDLEWRDNHPACASSTATMHVAVALSLSTRLYIYILLRERCLININRQQKPRHHNLDEDRSRLSPPIELASCRPKSNRMWRGATKNTLHRSLRAISLYHLRGNTL